ncbi:Crp/Fnr family transcriptional regulator [Flavobacterium oreochromis]|uniref:Crp/Fnr family transcriptional regulator n=2 Tax=Flavobacterium TaxID=237 RepID=A0A246GD71_9FLAO|nr:cyclic nucleotide-binding domain-containing protein [Flavobacterium oreochromis]OWP78490.1 Crp/Fnr family transcriptional regulator [Flavobacterium oreochromis]OWP79259.1 Crp/Fnr family transcriptional regulator [Flavobacterium oreochromis]POR30478.1 Crp/Fnr family transcriptional regulator [Flavobacterium columnare]QYS86982.1 Crp/Fnr family transcriptional regulator [Flavobacterium oreochromis]
MQNQLYQIFKEHELFEKSIELKRNDFLVEKEIIDTNIYFIEDGSLKISVFNKHEQIIRFGYKNNFIVTLDSFISEKPTEFYIQAIKKTTVLVTSKLRFQKFIQADILHFQLWNRILEDLILQQIEREKDLLLTTSKERYLKVLKRNPNVFQEIPHKLIANYLRMSPETLSRLKSLDVYQEKLEE